MVAWKWKGSRCHFSVAGFGHPSVLGVRFLILFSMWHRLNNVNEIRIFPLDVVSSHSEVMPIRKGDGGKDVNNRFSKISSFIGL